LRLRPWQRKPERSARKRTGHFSLLVQRKVTKRKDAPAPRPPHILCSGSACGDGIFRRCIHAPSKNDAHPAHRPTGLPPPPAAPQGPRKGSASMRSRARPFLSSLLPWLGSLGDTRATVPALTASLHERPALERFHNVEHLQSGGRARRVARRMRVIVSSVHGCAVETARSMDAHFQHRDVLKACRWGVLFLVPSFCDKAER